MNPAKLEIIRNLDTLDIEAEFNDERLNFLKTLFGQCTKGCIEIRPIPSGNDRQWIPVDNITLPNIPEGKNVYFGVATHEYGKGGKEDIIQIPAVWVDIDFKETAEEKARELINKFHLEPSMIVKSGGGFHVYWILNTPVSSEDIAKIEEINRRLVNYFGGDKACVEAAHLLRLPGTQNYKYDPPRPVILESVTDHLYDLSDFDFLPPVASNAMPAPAVPQLSVIPPILTGVREGQRHTKAVSLAGKYTNRGLSKEEVNVLVHSWNQKNMPPLSTEELNKTIDDVYERYGKDHRFNKNDSGADLITVTGNMDYCKIIEESAMPAHEFLVKKFPENPAIIYPWLKKGEIGMITAERGVGKTFISLLIGSMATRPMEIGQWRTETPTGCLYIDGEMSANEMQERIFLLQKNLKKPEAPFILLSADVLRSKDLPAPNLTKPDWRDGILKYLKKHDEIGVFILDNLSCLTPGIDENNKRDWDQINQWLLQLRSINKAVIMIHHTGKNGKQRGTSGREDILDFSIQLTRPAGYSPEVGAHFEINFTKSRRLYGDIVKPFTLRLQPNGIWQVEGNEPSKDQQIIEMLKNGDRNKDIAEQLNCSPAYVSQVKKKAVKNETLTEDDVKKPKPEKESTDTKEQKI